MDHDEFLRQVVAIIEEHGFFIQRVFPCEGDPPEWFAYTVGLTGAGHPEVIVHGLDLDVANALLDVIGERVLAGERFDPGATVPELHRKGFPLTFVRVDDTSLLTLVGAVYGEVDAVQLVHTDRRGRLPRDTAYKRDRRMPQRLLGPPPTT